MKEIYLFEKFGLWRVCSIQPEEVSLISEDDYEIKLKKDPASGRPRVGILRSTLSNVEDVDHPINFKNQPKIFLEEDGLRAAIEAAVKIYTPQEIEGELFFCDEEGWVFQEGADAGLQRSVPFHLEIEKKLRYIDMILKSTAVVMGTAIVDLKVQG